MVRVERPATPASSRANTFIANRIDKGRLQTQLGVLQENIMATVEQKRCAHLPCRCAVQAGEKYCGPVCKDAGPGGVEIACQCDHKPCPLTS